MLGAEYAFSRDQLFPTSEIDNVAVSQIAAQLRIFYTYVIYTLRNNSVYIGLSRMDPNKKMDNMSQRIRWAPEFDGFWGCYDLIILKSDLTLTEAVEIEQISIDKIRKSTRYTSINKSGGGEAGYPLRRAIANAAREKYIRYLEKDLSHQRFWSLGEWAMDPQSTPSTLRPQLPMPAEYFRPMIECVKEVAREFRAEHIRYIKQEGTYFFPGTQRHELADFLE